MANGKEMTKTNGNLPGKFLESDNVTGSDDIGADDIKTPRINLAQPSSTSQPEGVKGGEFYNSLTGDNYGNSLHLIMFKVWPSRAKFDTASNSLECKSEDCITGSKHGACGDCVHAKWPPKGGEKKSPACSQGYTYIVLPTGEVKEGMKSGTIRMPSLFTLAKSQIPAAKMINSNITVEKGYKRSAWCQTYQLSTVEKTFAVGKAFVIKVNPGVYVTQEQFKYLKGIADLVEKTDYKTKASESGADTDAHVDHEAVEKVQKAASVISGKPAGAEKGDTDLPF